MAGAVEAHAGVKTHFGKFKNWCKGGGPAPDDLADECPDAWVADKPLGTPLGSDELVKKHAGDRMQNEQKLLAELPHFRDLQSAWALLSLSAAQKANHTIRVLPPTLSRTYAEGHDGAIWDTFCEIL